MTGWQPIETAPKDGSFVDLWCIDNLYPDHPHRRTDCWWDKTGEGSWCDPNADHGEAADLAECGVTPTHWMRPPAPPA